MAERTQLADAAPSPYSGAPPTVRAIHAKLRHELVTLRLPPATRLSENELALRFGTSRAPVREALIRLADEGFIEILPQRGSFVSRISIGAMRRARFVREAIEISVVRQAATDGLSKRVRADIDKAIADQIAARDDAEKFTLADDALSQQPGRRHRHRAALVGARARESAIRPRAFSQPSAHDAGRGAGRTAQGDHQLRSMHASRTRRRTRCMRICPRCSRSPTRSSQDIRTSLLTTNDL